MAKINYYLDKVDKNGYAPIHMRIICNASQIKVSTGKKIRPQDFDKSSQLVIDDTNNINHFLKLLKERTFDLLDPSQKVIYTESEIKNYLKDIINTYKIDSDVTVLKEQLSLYGTPVAFIDLFAGAGGFSEGFLQAEENGKYFDFISASDINNNCELTHIVRYNYQLGLKTTFLQQDITEPDFIDNLLGKTKGKKIDVVCGGPPCQSFSLAGKRKKFDKKDDLFSHYLDVIKTLQPKYFIMENVKGILTKEGGIIKDLILKEINSIIDIKEVPKLISFIKSLEQQNISDSFIYDCLIKKIELEQSKYEEKEASYEAYINFVESKFRQLTPEIVDYKTSKTDKNISTIRHGLNLLKRNKEWEKLKRDIIKEKDYSNIDNDDYQQLFSTFINEISIDSTIQKIEHAFQNLKTQKQHYNEYEKIISALKIYTSSLDDTLIYIKELCNDKQALKFETIIDSIKLYNIDKPFIANASNYGVPQNRERVLFIGCRKDQELITEIPPTVNTENKVTVFEALHDLDFIGNNQEAHQYAPQKTHDSNSELLLKRTIDGKIDKNGKLYSEWSKKGRLTKRYKEARKPFYVKNIEALNNDEKLYDILNNHKTSNQSQDVIKRLEIILNTGDYKKAQDKLNLCGLASNKRNYNVLKPNEQSPTVMTIPDDYIHYGSPRALTVREMARLQSFDDSFVFQGKRSTGGNNRKSEVPQFTLVGNAVPPLLARAIGVEILRNIK
ncbi:MAG: DNA cytosine methyltransferase [Saprospiraceae bacterium]|nr:DNA cytosine methyltransferase [Saprospiraceae bacterium]